MCFDPLTLTAMALGAGGKAVSGFENDANNRRMIEARNAATRAELERQKGYQGQTSGIFNTSVGGFAPEAQQATLASGKADASALFSGNAPTALNVGTIGTKTAGDYTKGAEAKTVADVFAGNAARSSSLANLTGWDNAGMSNRMNLNNAGMGMDVIRDFSRNSARVGGLEQQVNANNAWRPPSGLGDLLSFAGNAVGFGSGGGMTLPTNSAFGNGIPWSWGAFQT
jgi:hypothetical protein